MRGIILGSGIVGLLAKEILGSEWTIIPYSRSRFYSFKPALADNFIVRDQRIDDFVLHLGGKPGFIYNTVYSFNGALHKPDDMLNSAWLFKVFGDNPPSQAKACMAAKKSHFIYDLKLNVLYQQLQQKYGGELLENSKKGPITELTKNSVVWAGQRVEFDHLISTVPLYALPTLEQTPNVSAKPLWYFHIETADLDFEGASQVLVVDDMIDFYKASNIAKGRYLFYFLHDAPLPGPYFSKFMKRFEIIDGTMVPNALPTGERPNLKYLEDLNVHCVGMFAEWDPFLDVGSSLIRILKYQSDWSAA